MIIDPRDPSLIMDNREPPMERAWQSSEGIQLISALAGCCLVRKWMWCRIVQPQVCNSLKSIETLTPRDHVEFRISQRATLLFFLPTTSFIPHPSLLSAVLTHPPFSPRFQFVHSFVCLRSRLPSSQPFASSSPPSSMYSVSVGAFILSSPCLLYSLTPPSLLVSYLCVPHSPCSVCFHLLSTFAILTPPFSPHLQVGCTFVISYQCLLYSHPSLHPHL